MTERLDAAARFVRVVGWLFLVTAALALVVSGAQVALLYGAAPGVAVDGRALAVAFGLVAASSIVAVIAVAFLKRQRWARAALTVIAALGVAASLARLLLPASPVEPPPPEAPAEYLRLLQLISLVDILAPIATSLALGWILWRLRSAAVRDQFR